MRIFIVEYNATLTKGEENEGDNPLKSGDPDFCIGC